MKKLLIVLLTLGSLSAVASEITCGETSKLKANRDNLEIQITLKKPALAENVDLSNLTGSLASKGSKKEVILVRFNSLEDYAIHSMAEDGMIKGVQMMFNKAFVCYSTDSLRLGVERSPELALKDLLKHLKH